MMPSQPYIDVDSPPDLKAPHIAERPRGSGTYMRLSDDARKCVVFLGHAPEGENRVFTKLEGTGFLVTHGEPLTTYIVTAAHVACRLEDRFALRVNRKDNGKGELVHFEKTCWFNHPNDEASDVAVMAVELPDWADIAPYKTKFFVTDFKKNTKDIGAGDMAYVVGLFYLLYGKQRNMAIVQTGNIAMMPEEKVPGHHWKDKKKEIERTVYVVQAPTLPWSSGSPVFVRRSLRTAVMDHSVKDGNTLVLNPVQGFLNGSVWLLGLWSSAWFGDADNVYVPPPLVGKITVPQSMGYVVPATHILEALDQPDAKAQRDAMRAAQTNPPEYTAAPDDPSALSAEDADTNAKVERVVRVMLANPPAPKRAKRTPGKKAKSR